MFKLDGLFKDYKVNKNRMNRKDYL